MSRVPAYIKTTNVSFNDQGVSCVSNGVGFIADTNDGTHLYMLANGGWGDTGFTTGGTRIQGIVGRADGKVVVVGQSGVVWAYDPVTDTQDDGTVLTAWPNQRRYAIPVQDDNVLYMVGGSQIGGSGSPPITTVDKYDAETDTWTTSTAITAGLWKGAGCVRGNLLVVFGEDVSHNTVCYRLNRTTLTWSTSAVDLSGLSFSQGICAAVEDGNLCVVHEGAGPDTTPYIYDAGADTITALSANAPSYTGIDLVGGVQVNGTTYLFGYTGNPGLTGSAIFYFADPTSDVPFLVANDRYQTVSLPVRGTTTTTAEFRYWSVAAPYWSETLTSTSSIPTYYTFDELGSPTYGSLELPYRQIKTGFNAAIDGIVVRFTPRPSALTTEVAVTNSVVTFIARVEGHGLSSYERSATGGSSGVAQSDPFTFSDAGNQQDSSAWPNIRTVFIPARLDTPVRAVRVIFSQIALCEIVPPVELVGTLVPAREV